MWEFIRIYFKRTRNSLLFSNITSFYRLRCFGDWNRKKNDHLISVNSTYILLLKSQTNTLLYFNIGRKGGTCFIVRGNILFRKFHMCSVSMKLNLFNSYCASMYTPHLWWNYKKMSICKLQITYHNILKMNIGFF